MHEEPLHLIPPGVARRALIEELGLPSAQYKVRGRRRPRPGLPLHLPRADGRSTRATGRKVMQARARRAARPVARRTASASAPSSPRTRRTRTRPSSPATSTTARSPSTAPTPTRAPSTSTASSTSPTAASSSSSRSSSSTWPSSTTCWARRRSTRSSPRSSPQTDIDEVILGHTNEAEYKKLLNNEFMEALRDRTDQDRHPLHHAS